MNLTMREKQTDRHKKQTCSGQGEGPKGRGGSLGLAAANYYI